MDREYDPSDAVSIFQYSGRLLHNTLAQIIPLHNPDIDLDCLEAEGKGGLGILVEKYFFGYEPNSSPEPDFPKAGVELKVTPLKKDSKDQLVIKERLACDMIDYMSIVDEEFEDSRFFKKSVLMLIIFYLHLKGYKRRDLEFIYSVLWQIKDKDLLIIKKDFLLIREKVRQGKAHEISEGDTMYLGACRKGQKNQKPRKQPNSNTLANARAFSFKTAYMRTILEFVKSKDSDMATNLTGQDMPGIELVSLQQLQEKSFDDILKDRFSPYIGLDYKQIAKRLNIKVNAAEKSKYATIVKNILLKGLKNVEDLEEIRKAGIKIKTIRLQKNGTIREHMSFEQIDYDEIFSADDWTDSKWYEIVTTKYMFVIFREIESNKEKESRYILDKMFFWTMPPKDMDLAEEFWQNIKDNVTKDTLLDDNNTFWRLKDHRCFHVRPKAKTADDVTHSPVSGVPVPKKAYWFDNKYLMQEIKNAYGDEWEKLFNKKI